MTAAGLPQFGFVTAGAIRFGRGTAAEAADTAAALGRRVLLVHGRAADRARWLIDDLTAAGCSVATVACTGEPDLDQLETAVAEARQAGADVTVGIGGGAALDLAKAVAALAPSDGPPRDYLEVVGSGRRLDRPPLPFVALPTTAGTGAEVTKNAVIGVPEERRKVSLRDDRMLARAAIVDPALTDGAPRTVTLASGLDAVTQVIEPYLSARANPLTDALTREAIPRGLRALVRLMQAEDPIARDEMAFVSLCGGLALANSGLGAVHGLAGVLGGRTGAAHGAICGALLVHALRANQRALAPRTEAARRLAEVLGWIEEATGLSPEGFAAWCHGAGLPRLAETGLSASEVGATAEAALGASSMRGNPVALSAGQVAALLDAALAQEAPTRR